MSLLFPISVSKAFRRDSCLYRLLRWRRRIAFLSNSNPQAQPFVWARTRTSNISGGPAHPVDSSAIHKEYPMKLRYSQLSLKRNFWIMRRGGAVTDPALIDLSSDRKPLPRLLGDLDVSVCSIKGYRSYMEDEFICTNDYCAVFDGHGGPAVSKYLRQNLYGFMQAALPSSGNAISQTGTSSPPSNTADPSSPIHLTLNKAKEAIPSSLSLSTHYQSMPPQYNPSPVSLPAVEDFMAATLSAFKAIDEKVQRISHWSYQGSTATGIWIHEDNSTGNRTLVLGHVGDSRAILSRKDHILELSCDHKPNHPLERARIESVGGKVDWCGKTDRKGRPIVGTGVYRVNGNLALARAIGDRSERPAVSAVPDVNAEQLSSDDQFLVIATDGLWDVMGAVDVVGFIHALLEEDDGDLLADRDYVAAKLVEEALRRGSYDNVTVIIVWLDHMLMHARNNIG